MADLKSRYNAILKELENHFKNEEDREFVVSKFQEISIMFMDIIDRLTVATDIRVNELEEKQKQIEEKISKVQKAVNGIENDIYEDDEAYEFEITCPYCNNEFVTDVNSEANSEIECPECHNIIELDWNSEEECECSHCDCRCEDDDCNDECCCDEDCDCGCQEGKECTCGDNCNCNHEDDEEDNEDM